MLREFVVKDALCTCMFEVQKAKVRASQGVTIERLRAANGGRSALCIVYTLSTSAAGALVIDEAGFCVARIAYVVAASRIAEHKGVYGSLKTSCHKTLVLLRISSV